MAEAEGLLPAPIMRLSIPGFLTDGSAGAGTGAEDGALVFPAGVEAAEGVGAVDMLGPEPDGPGVSGVPGGLPVAARAVEAGVRCDEGER